MVAILEPSYMRKVEGTFSATLTQEKTELDGNKILLNVGINDGPSSSTEIIMLQHMPSFLFSFCWEPKT